MQLVSVNVGLPQTITWKGQTVQTGIFNTPTNGRVRVRTLNLVEDVANLYRDGPDQVSLLQRVVQVEALPANWRDHFQQQIDQLQR